ncbi:hypothetical protein IG631_17784 [Alternaria alternata]|nr:hypothetical protein IG631_17784 [Alternaria alternata]
MEAVELRGSGRSVSGKMDSEVDSKRGEDAQEEGTGAGGDHECGMAGRAVTGKDRGKLSWGLLSSRSPLETRARCRHPLRHIGDGCPLWGMQLDATRIACRDSNAQCALVATV